MPNNDEFNDDYASGGHQGYLTNIYGGAQDTSNQGSSMISTGSGTAVTDNTTSYGLESLSAFLMMMVNQSR